MRMKAKCRRETYVKNLQKRSKTKNHCFDILAKDFLIGKPSYSTLSFAQKYVRYRRDRCNRSYTQCGDLLESAHPLFTSGQSLFNSEVDFRVFFFHRGEEIWHKNSLTVNFSATRYKSSFTPRIREVNGHPRREPHLFPVHV